jgi:hypothetical protein
LVVVVRAYTVDHAWVVPAHGSSVECGGRAVGIGGDADLPGVRAFADGAELLEGEVMDSRLTRDGASPCGQLGWSRNKTLCRDIMEHHVDGVQLDLLPRSTSWKGPARSPSTTGRSARSTTFGATRGRGHVDDHLHAVDVGKRLAERALLVRGPNE